jgi:hypothetical protein
MVERRQYDILSYTQDEGLCERLQMERVVSVEVYCYVAVCVGIWDAEVASRL